MKFWITIILIFIGIFTFSLEKYSEINGELYIIEINEDGDTISIEKIKTIENTQNKEDKNEEKNKSILSIGDKPLLNNIIPVNWETGLWTFGYGFVFGPMFVSGFSDNLSEEVSIMAAAIMPIAMLALPVLIINEKEIYSVTPMIKDGYVFGFGDYYLTKYIIEEYDSLAFFQADPTLAVLSGFAESWGGYFLAKSLNIKRSGALFYSRGGYLGAFWGLGIGMYGELKTDSSEFPIMPVSILASSIIFRSLGMYIGNTDRLYWYSKDADIILLNSAMGYLLGLDFFIHSNNSPTKESLLFSTIGMSMLGALTTGVVMQYFNIHYDDGSALLTVIGSILGGSLGSAIQVVTTNIIGDFYMFPVVLGMFAGESAVYFLRQNTIKSNRYIENIGFNIMPNMNNGISANLKFNF